MADKRGMNALTLGAFAVGGSGLAVIGLLSSLTIELDVSEPEAVQLLTVFGLGYATCSVLLGVLSWRRDDRALLVGGLLVVALGEALGALAPHFEQLLLTRLVTAIGAALFTSAIRSRGRAMVGGLGAAIVLGVPAAALFSQQFGFRSVLLGLTALSLVSAVAVAAVPIDAQATVRIRVRTGRAWPLLVVTVLAAMAGFSVYALVMPVLAAGDGVRGTAVVIPLLGYGLGAVAGQMLSRQAVRRWGAKWVLPGTLGLMVALPLLVDVRIAATVFVVLWGLCGWAVDPPVRRLFAETAPLRAGYGWAVGLGIGLAGLLGGVVLYRYGPDALPQVAAVLAACALVVAVVSDFRREGRRGPGALLAGSEDTTGALPVSRAVGKDRGRFDR